MVYTWSFTNGENTYTSANIVSGTLNQAMFTECSIGNVTGKQLNLKLWNVDLDTTSPIVLSVSDGSSTSSMGTYFIDKYTTSPYSDYSEVTAFDAILKTEAVYMKEGTWDDSITAEALVEDIAEKIGVGVVAVGKKYIQNLGITMDQVPNIGENGTTCRQILQTIAALAGGSFYINMSNSLDFAPLFVSLMLQNPRTGTIAVNYYDDGNFTGRDDVIGFDHGDPEYIVGIEFQANGGQSFRYPSNLTDEQWEALEGRILYNNLPFMASQAAVDRVGALYVDGQSKPTGIPYIPYTANTFYIAPNSIFGYGVKIKDTLVQITNRTINIDALAACDLSAETSRQAESYYPYISPQVREARQKAEENYAAIMVNTESITAEVRRATTEEGNLSSEMTSVRQTAEEFSVWHTTSAQTEMDDAAQAAVDDYANTVETYMRYSGGTLELGQTGSNFKAKLSNTRLAFTGADGQDAAWITNNQLNINEAVIQNDIQLPAKSGTGKWVQQVASNNHFQIRWIG